MEFIIMHSDYDFFNVSVFHSQRMNKQQDPRNYKRDGFYTPQGQFLLGLFWFHWSPEQFLIAYSYNFLFKVIEEP